MDYREAIDDGQQLLSIENCFVFLPKDFKGDIADALEFLAKRYREIDENFDMESTVIQPWEKQPTTEDIYDKAIDNFVHSKGTSDYIGRVIISKYDKKVYTFVHLKP